MTTIDTAAAWRTLKLVTFAAFTTLVGTALTGCGTTTGIFPAGSDGSSTLVEQSAATKTAPIGSAKVAIAPVIGAPDVVAKQLQAELTQALAKSSIPVAASPSDSVAYTLRGYVVSAREQANTKISYIWDVTDSSGKRVNRITGEEVASASAGADPWSSMTPQVVQAISSKTANSLATWLPTQLKAAQAPAAIANSAAAKAANGAANTANSALQTAAKPIAGAAATGTTTGSIQKPGSVTAVIPAVTGAPGDGGMSLTNAMRRELSRNGIQMAGPASKDAYKVLGRVKIGKGASGKQPIQIDWDVRDPNGKKVGAVSQKNDVPKDSLNGPWGKTADAVAAAATQGILKLLAKPTSTN